MGGKRSFRVLEILTIILFCFVLIRTAWICDDAFITLRTVDNFLNGYGLTWNASERVQSYTHPLWMFLLIISHSITREPYYSTVFLSIVFSIITLLIMIRLVSRHEYAALIAVLILSFSKAYIDYSTSDMYLSTMLNKQLENVKVYFDGG